MIPGDSHNDVMRSLYDNMDQTKKNALQLLSGIGDNFEDLDYLFVPWVYRIKGTRNSWGTRKYSLASINYKAYGGRA